jgi:glycosyltransferase involved in cell wall biosynthesis
MYNEEAYARRAVAAARAVLVAAVPDWEIVIVDDASTDGTGRWPTPWPARTRAFA